MKVNFLNFWMAILCFFYICSWQFAQLTWNNKTRGGHFLLNRWNSSLRPFPLTILYNIDKRNIFLLPFNVSKDKFALNMLSSFVQHLCSKETFLWISIWSNSSDPLFPFLEMQHILPQNWPFIFQAMAACVSSPFGPNSHIPFSKQNGRTASRQSAFPSPSFQSGKM